MKEIETFGISSFGDRRLHLLAADRIGEIPSIIDLGTRYFVCVLAMEADGIPDDEISTLAYRLVMSGCAYLCAWGDGCERAHGLADIQLVSMEAERPTAMEVITTSHKDEPLTEVLWYALNVAWPAKEFEDDCSSTLIITVGQPDWAETCREALRDPAAFNARVLAEETQERAAQQRRARDAGSAGAPDA